MIVKCWGSAFQVSETASKKSRDRQRPYPEHERMLVLVDPAEKGGPEDSVGEVGARHARTFRFNSACKDVLIIFIIFLCLVLTLNKSHSWKKKNHWKFRLASDIPGTSQHKQYITLYSKHQCPIKGEPFEEFHMVCKSLITAAFLKVKVRSF